MSFITLSSWKRNFTALIITALSLFSFTLNAQTNWNLAMPTDGSGSTGAETGRGICTDINGNVYVIGVFNGASDFDMNPATTAIYTSQGNDGYIASYDKNGNFRWYTVITGAGSDMAAPSGAICTNGTYVYFTGAANVNGSVQLVNSLGTTLTVPATGTASDVIVGKLNCSSGAPLWATTFGSSTSNDGGEGICVDPAGCCYVVGSYGGTFTSNGHTAPVSGGASDLFVAKFSPGGSMVRLATGGSSSGADMISNGGGICYVPGATPAIVAVGSCANGGTITYGSFSTATSGSIDQALVELDTTLNITNALVSGISTATDEFLGATYDPFSGGVFVTGYYNGGAITLSGTASMNNSGVQDMLLARYSVTGNNFTWAAHAGGAGDDRGEAVTADGQGGILVSGNTGSATCTFSGSVSVSNTGGLNDMYAAHYNTSGTPVWALATGGSGDDQARGIASYVVPSPFTQYVFITGNFQNSVTFNGTTLVADGGNDFFLARINDLSTPLSATQSQVNLTCNGVCNGSATVVASGGISPYSYSWSPSGGSGATASSLCANNYTVTITDAASSTITKTFSITQPPAITITTISQTNVSCFGGSNGAAQVTSGGGTGTLTYNWTPGNPTGDGTGSVSALTAGTWTVTVTDANSCTAARTFTITQPPAVTVNPVAQTNVSCFGGSTGAASVTASGGTPGYSYDWTPGNPTGDGTASVTGLTAGTWTCTVTDANGCTGSRTFNITQPTSAVSGTTVVTNVACFGGTNGAINLTPTGGTPGYTYNWLPSGPTTQNRTALAAGTYTVQITDVNGCTGNVSATVTQPTSPVSGTTVVTNVACFGGNTGAINLTPAGGTPGYTYNWLPSGPTTQNRTALVAGTYTVQITDVNGCTGTVNATVTQPSSSVSGTTVVTNVACFGGNTGAINLTPSGGAPGYTYNWLPSGPTTQNRTSLTAGTYTVQITDANGCTGNVTATVTQPTSPVSGTTVVTNVACFGGNTGAINLTPTGGTSGYTYNWLPSGPTTQNRTALVAGTYTVQITDANGCTGNVTATVTQPTSTVSGTTVVTNVACFGGNTGAINLTPTGGTPGYTYNWLPSGPTTQNRTALVAGTYTVQITDANGCTGTVNATVTQPTSPVSGTTVVTNVACFGGTTGAINLTPSGGTGSYTYNWLPSGPTTQNRTGLAAGTYTVQITDANGCTGTVNATVTQPTAPVSGTTVVTNVACFGGNTGAINLTPTGGTGSYTYNWLPSGPTTQNRTALVAGTYTVQITDANGCTGTVNATVTQPTAPVSGTTVVTNVACFGGTTGAINLTPTGGTSGYTYNWLPSGPTTQNRTGLVAGTYTVQITDANGCTGTVNATVTQPSSPVSGTTVVTNVSCFGSNNGAINLTPGGGTPGYTYNWLPSGPTTQNRTGLTAGTYTVQITDANGCTGTVSATVTQPASTISGTTVVTNVACFGGNTGAISLTPSGGAPGYTYNWLPSGPTTQNRTGLTAGTYTVQITDSNGCTGTASATVTQPAAAVSGTTVVTNVACFGGNTGAINLSPTGGTGSYTYNWLPSGPTTQNRTALVAGTYTVQITDANGCTGNVTATVTQPTAPVSGTTVVTNVACFGGTTGAINLTPTGGTSGYTYNWLPSGPTTQNRTNLTAGTYTVQITDANGCTGTVNATVTQPTSPVSGTTVVTNVACFGGTTGAISLTPGGGTPGYTYNWLPSGPTTQNRTGLAAGTYTVQITDANGCTGTVNATVTQPSSPVSGTTVVTNVACFGGNTGAINLTPTGGTPGYTYNWLPSGPTTQNRTNLTAGTYTVQITDANGCTGTVNATVTQPSSPVSGTTVVTNVACFGGNTGAINLTPTGGTGSYTYNWLPSGPTTEDRTGLVAGAYTVQITDVNGCTGTVNATVTQPSSPVSGTTVVTNVACFGGNTGAINLTPTGGVGSYTYNWLPSGPTTEDRTGLVAGTYTVQITDANGCTGTVNATVTQPTSPVSGTTVVTNVACFGGNTGAINLTPAGGVGSYTYNWLPSGPTIEDRTGLVAGTYTVQITDANGCTGTVNATVTQPSSPVSGTTVVTNVSCAGGNDGAIDLTPTGGVGLYTYNWLPAGPTTEDRTNLTAGTYTVQIMDMNGCTGTVTATVVEPTALAITFASTNVSCNGICDGTATINVTGGTPAYTYNWLPSGGTTSSATGLCAGTYTCMVTDSHGCSATQIITITEPAPLVANATAPAIVCNGGSTTVTVTATGGTSSYTGTGTFTASAGTYNYTVTDAHGCSGTATITIADPAAIAGSQTLTVCAGQSVTVGSSTYNTSGTYTDVLPASNSCDSTVTTNLTVLAPITGTQDVTLCAGQSLTIGSNTYSTSGTYTDVLTASNSCDSTLTTNLTILAPIDSTQNVTVCAGHSITVGTSTYTASGTYTDVIPSSMGCDSTVTTNLTVLPVSSGSQTLTVCAGIGVIVGGNTYNTSGTYTDTLVSANGCDSTVTTNLTVLPENSTTNTITLCAGQSVTVGSHTYNTTGVYTDIFTAANGCDSTIVTDLTITTVDVTLTVSDPSATANQGSATYQWLDCTGMTALTGQTSQSFTATMSGTYAVSINYNGCADTSDCVMIIADGIAEQAAQNSVNVYPNPASDVITVEVTNIKAGDENTIMVYDAIGKLVYAVNSTTEKTTIDLGKFPKGIYFIRLQNANGVITRKITKQ